MWYILYANTKERDWISFTSVPQAKLFIDKLLESGQPDDEIIVLNASEPENILSAEEFKEMEL